MSNEFGAIYIVAHIFISLLAFVFSFPLRVPSILLVKRRYVSGRLVTYLIIVVSVNLKEYTHVERSNNSRDDAIDFA